MRTALSRGRPRITSRACPSTPTALKSRWTPALPWTGTPPSAPFPGSCVVPCRATGLHFKTPQQALGGAWGTQSGTHCQAALSRAHQQGRAAQRIPGASDQHVALLKLDTHAAMQSHSTSEVLLSARVHAESRLCTSPRWASRLKSSRPHHAGAKGGGRAGSEQWTCIV